VTAAEPDAAPLVVLPHRYELVRVADVHPHPRNPNRGDVDGIGESVDALGFYGALIVNGPTGDILAGSHRWVVARERGGGDAELPALVYEVDEDTAERIMLGDNEWARRARWDMAALVDVLRDRAATPAQLTATGFTQARFAELVATMTPAPPDAFRTYDEDLPTEHRCPSCGYEWSGKAAP
jgi:ParB-like chromosome segregation protein Spo0J